MLICAVLGMTGAVRAQAQDAAEEPSRNGEITAEALQGKIELLKSKQNLSEETKTRILMIYHEIEDSLDEKKEYDEQIDNFQNALKMLPLRLKNLSADIEHKEQQLKNRTPENFSSFPTDEIEQRLVIEKSRLSELNTEINQLEQRINEQSGRSAKILEEINAARSELEKIAVPKDLAPPEAKAESEALQWRMQAGTKALNVKLKMLELEGISLPLRLQKMKYDLQVLNIRRDGLTLLIKEIEEHLIERTQVEADRTEREMLLAEKEASGKHVLIQEATRENIRLSRTLQLVNKKMEKIGGEKAKLEALNKLIEKDYQSAERKINLAGLSPALGNILRVQRRDLPTREGFKALSKNIQNETALASLEQFKLEDMQKRLSDTGVMLQSMMDERLEPDASDEDKLMIRTELRLLLNNQRELVNKLYAVYSNYARSLVELDFAKQQLLSRAEKFADFLDRRLLWVPSDRALDRVFLAELYRSALWLLSPVNWKAAAVDLFAGARTFPLVSILFLAAIGALRFFKTKLKTNFRDIQKKASKPYTDKFSYTLSSMFLILLLVLPAPLFLLLCGGLLELLADSAPFSKNLAAGFYKAAFPLLILQYFYKLFSPEGIVQNQFQWSPETVNLLHRQLNWLRFVAVPALFFIGLSGQDIFSQNAIALGRVGLIVAMLAMSYVMHVFLNPGKGVFVNFYESNPRSLVTKLRHVWYAVGVLTPVVIVGFTVAGYYLSALELEQRLVLSIRLVFAAVLVHALAIRWMALANRRLALQNARQKRKIQEQASKQAATGGEGSPVIDEQLLDIPKINTQTRRLLTVTVMLFLLAGFWVVWKDILPAFSILDQIVLWRHVEVVDSQETLSPVTLVNLLLALLYGFVAVVVMRNLSGLLELLLAGKLAVEAGSRYAINQLMQYTVAGIAFVGVANELGGSWKQVQWLVAALGVGLGFGLQEIFANMVSGIILLFERPIRVGDTVSVGDITGKVNRIQMRATQIIDWDQKEVIVPNKTFITDRLVNWTLTDPTTRVVIPLGIAYDSDVELAFKVITETVKNTPLVLEEPEPSIYFVGFGESSLDFTIRAYVRELSNRLPLTNELHLRLLKALRENGIEIPFPQRDLHIRSAVEPGRP
ncbi:MAG: mechanosensitive ion channel domain-containing protein [Gammaproteobacteria bacterium]